MVDKFDRCSIAGDGAGAGMAANAGAHRGGGAAACACSLGIDVRHRLHGPPPEGAEEDFHFRHPLSLETMSTPEDPREGLWDPERNQTPAPRKRALPKSRVSLTLWTMIALVVVVAIIGLFI